MAGPGKLLVANRGEIAVRIIRAARELGLATVQVHSNADAALLAVRLADEATEIGPPQASKSYLKVEAILKAARATGATAHDHHRRCKRLTSPASQGPDHHRSEPL